MKPRFIKYLINIYPPFWGTGITVKSVSSDYKHVRVQMKLRWYNRNIYNTHFGGSLYAMTDPFFALMVLHILGKGYVVWDKTSNIEYIKASRGTVTADFFIKDEQLLEIKDNTSEGKKHYPEFSVDIKNEAGERVARVIKTLYIRKVVTTGSNGCL
ncbi:DUF4442 domain-containing protein [Thermodesulfobacteriota bacterium]